MPHDHLACILHSGANVGDDGAGAPGRQGDTTGKGRQTLHLGGGAIGVSQEGNAEEAMHALAASCTSQSMTCLPFAVDPFP